MAEERTESSNIDLSMEVMAKPGERTPLTPLDRNSIQASTPVPDRETSKGVALVREQLLALRAEKVSVIHDEGEDETGMDELLHSRFSELQVKLINVREENKEYCERYEAIREEGRRLLDAYEIKSSKLRGLHQLFTKLEAETDNLRRGTAAQFAENKKLLHHVQFLTSSLQQSRNNENSLQKHFDDLSVAEKRSREEVEQLRIELAAAAVAETAFVTQASDIDLADGSGSDLNEFELRQRLRCMQISETLLRERNSELDKLSSNLQLEVDELQAKACDYDRIILTAQRAHDLEKRVMDLEAQRQTAITAHEQVSAEVQELRNRLDCNHEQMAIAQKEVQAILSENFGREEVDAMSFNETLARICSHSVKLRDEAQQKAAESFGMQEHLQSLNMKMATLCSENEVLQKRCADQFKTMTNLQDDLCLAYKKHEREISSLEQTYRHDDYKRRYQEIALECEAADAQLVASIEIASLAAGVQDANERLAHRICQKAEQLQQDCGSFDSIRRSLEEQVSDLQIALLQARNDSALLHSKLIASNAQLSDLQRLAADKDKSIEILEARVSEACSESRIEVNTILASIVDNAIDCIRSNEFASVLAEVEQLRRVCKQKAELNHQVEVQENELTLKTKELEQCLSKNRAQNAEICRLQQERDELAEFISNEGAVNSEHQSGLECELGRLKDELELKTAEIAELRNVPQSDAAKMEKLVKQVEELTLLREEQDAEIEIAQAERFKMDEELKSATEKSKEYARKLKSLHAAFESKSEEVEALTVQLSIVREQNDAVVRKKLSDAEKRADREKTRARKIEEKLDEFRRRTKHSERQLQSTNTRHEELEVDLIRLRSEKESLAEHVLHYKREWEANSEALRRIQSQSAGLQGMCETLQAKVQELSEQKACAAEAADIRANELRELREHRDRLEKLLTAERSHREDTNTEVASLRAIAATPSATSSRSKIRRDSDDDMVQAQRVLQDLRRRNKILEQHLAESQAEIDKKLSEKDKKYHVMFGDYRAQCESVMRSVNGRRKRLKKLSDTLLTDMYECCAERPIDQGKLLFIIREARARLGTADSPDP